MKAKLERTNKILPITAVSKPLWRIGWMTIISTPKRLTKVPTMVLGLVFSFRNKREPRSKKTGTDDPIIGALILGANFNPQRVSPILTPNPINPRKKSLRRSPQSTFKRWMTNGRIISVAKAKRKKPSVIGVTFSNDHLKIGALAPQIILANISPRIASL